VHLDIESSSGWAIPRFRLVIGSDKAVYTILLATVVADQGILERGLLGSGLLQHHPLKAVIHGHDSLNNLKRMSHYSTRHNCDYAV
jgi:hypothetical protein